MDDPDFKHGAITFVTSEDFCSFVLLDFFFLFLMEQCFIFFFTDNTLFLGHLVKSVHMGLNKKTFYIYDKIYIFSCPGCYSDDFSLGETKDK